MAVANPTLKISKPPTRMSKFRANLKILGGSRVAVIGLSMVMFWVILGIISLFWTPHEPNASDFGRNQCPSWGFWESCEGKIGTENFLGTDHLGRDLLSRLMEGTQIILLKTRVPAATRFGIDMPEMAIPGGVALWGVGLALFLGSTLGLNAGYRGGWYDQVIMQVLDALIAFPRIVLYLIIIAALGQSDMVIVFAIMITGAPGVARLARSLAMDIKSRDYVRAAETRGESIWYIMFKEILPNARGPLLVDAMLRVGYAIFTIGTLGFLGVGLPPPTPDWGNMVNDARKLIFSSPITILWPALAIATLVIGLNLFADGMREELTRFSK